MSGLLTLYARAEPTTDRATLELRRLWPAALPGAQDVQLYKDPECRQPYARYAHDSRAKPTRRHRYVCLNSYRWRLEWPA